MQLIPTATTFGEPVATATASSNGVPSQMCPPSRQLKLTQAGTSGDALERPDERPRLDDRGDRLDREQVGLGLGERLHPRDVERHELVLAAVVVAGVLGAVAEHRAVRAHRRRDDVAVGVGLAGELDAPAHERAASASPSPRPARPSNVAW